MKRVAIFGNAGGGKSTLARRLTAITGLPLHALDLVKYRVGGAEVPHPEYLQAHAEILSGERWIIDGFGCVASAWERFEAADTLVYVDLPLSITSGSRSAWSRAFLLHPKAGPGTARSGGAA